MRKIRAFGVLMSHPLQAFFGKIRLFSSLDGDELNELLRSIRPVQLKADQILFSEGDPGDAAYVIESGRLEVYLERPDREITLATLEPGAILGEIALLDGLARTASARATEDVSLFRIDKAEFDFLRRNLRPAAFKVIRGISMTVCERLRETNAMIRDVMEESRGGESEDEDEEEQQSISGLLGRLAFWKTR
jgi:CRP/FNR family transcriptional regulator